MDKGFVPCFTGKVSGGRGGESHREPVPERDQQHSQAGYLGFTSCWPTLFIFVPGAVQPSPSHCVKSVQVMCAGDVKCQEMVKGEMQCYIESSEVVLPLSHASGQVGTAHEGDVAF